MGIKVAEFRDYLTENFAKIMIVFGILTLFLGVFSLDTFGTILSGSSLFIGILLIAYGFLLQVGLLSFAWRGHSINAIGTTLICVSIGFFALAIVALQFQVVKAEHAVEIFKGLVIPIVKLTGTHPYVYFFALGFQIGLVIFATGTALKIYDHFLR